MLPDPEESAQKRRQKCRRAENDDFHAKTIPFLRVQAGAA
jgi:hypothetical protein